jgi:hypothetical protein
METNTYRIIIPELNPDVEAESRKKSIRKYWDNPHNIILGEGSGLIDDRQVNARKRIVKMINNIENNKMWWGKETESLLGKMKENVYYNEEVDARHE